MINNMLDDADIRTGIARRDYMNRLPASEVSRLRSMLDLGLENVDIAREMGLNRSAVMYHRRRYDAELTQAERLPTEPWRAGRLNGRSLPPAQAARLRALLLDGVPASTAATALEVSKTCADRYRSRIVRELAHEGRTLPGCDKLGRPLERRSPVATPKPLEDDIRRRLMVPERIPAIAAATGTSAVTVRRIWKTLKPTLAAMPKCPCGKEAHHAQRCRPGTDLRVDGEALRRLVEAAVPRHHDAGLRADIVQDVTLRILAIPRPPSDLATVVRQTVAANYRSFANRWGDLSLDAPLGSEGDATLMDVLAARPA